MRFIIHPETSIENGFAHIKRCTKLAKDIDAPIFIFKKDFDDKLFKEIDVKILTDLDKESFDSVIIDKPKISQETLNFFLKKNYKIFSIEGDLRKEVHFLIDILPNLFQEKANINSIYLMDIDLSKKIKNKIITRKEDIKKILISFGGYDYKRFSKKLYDSRILQKSLKESKVFLLKGPKASWIEREDFLEWDMIKDKKNLDFDFLSEFDLVITYYGQMMFESLLSGVNVLLLNYSDYHSKLSQNIGIKEFGIEYPDSKRFEKLISNTKHFQKQFEIIDSSKKLGFQNLKDIFLKIKNYNNNETSCPFCFENSFKVLSREINKTFFKCKKCNSNFEQRFF